MTKDADPLVRAIFYTVTFPSTIAGVLFRPRKVFSPEDEESRCPPGVALGLALTAWFWGNRTLLRIESGDVAIPLEPGAQEIAKIVVGAAGLVLGPTLVLAGLLRTNWDVQQSS